MLDNVIRIVAEGIFLEEDVKIYIKRKLNLTDEQLEDPEFNITETVKEIIKELIIEDISIDSKIKIEETFQRQIKSAKEELTNRISQSLNITAKKAKI